MKLKYYIIRRILYMVPTFVLTTILIFSLIHIAPGDPIEIMFTEAGRPPPPEIIEKVRRQLGLDEPLYIQYLIWLNNLIHGKFGISYSGSTFGFSIISLIKSRILYTTILALSSQVLSLILAVSLGAFAASKQNSIIDNILSLVSVFGFSMPSFWFTLMMLFIFSMNLGWFPLFGVQTIGSELNSYQRIVDYLWHLFLPVVTLSVANTAWLFRMMRATMLEVLNQDYILTAKANGVKEKKIIYKYALRNAILPIVTIVGLNMGFIFSGAVVTETIFALPGLGTLAVSFAFQRDYPGLMALSVIIILMVNIVTLLTDITYALIDPRIRY